MFASKRRDPPYRSGRSPDWLKSKNPACAAVKREAEEDWGAMTIKVIFLLAALLMLAGCQNPGRFQAVDADAAAGAVEEVARVVARIRARWPRTRILLRADFRLRARGPDGLVRGQRRGLRVGPAKE